MTAIRSECSLLLVHAHPDDESIFTGATMAKYAAEGARVTLVTCTMGERGLNRLAHTVADDRHGIAELRVKELEAACAALGVTDHSFLGGPGRWRDSGAAGGTDPRCFARADVDEAASDLAAVIREVRPQAIITYDANGFYGHPDHIQAHRVAWRAYQLTCDPGLTKFYATTMPRSVLQEALRQPARIGMQSGPGPGSMLLGAPDGEVTTEIDVTAHLSAKLAALRSHATQIVVDEPFFHVVGLIEIRAVGAEYYTLLAGPGSAVPGGCGRVREDDLFSGCEQAQ